MNEELLNAVKQIIAKDGDAALDDAQRVNSLFADLAKDAPKPVKTAFVKCLEQGYAKIVKASPQGERASTRQKLAERLHEEEGLDTKRCYEALTVLEAALFGSAEEGVFAEAKASEPPKPAPNANPLIGTWFAKSPIMGHYHLYVEKPDEATLDCVDFFDKGDVVSAVTSRYEMKISVKGSKVTLNSVSGLNVYRGAVMGNLVDRQLHDFSLTMNANGTELKGTGQSRGSEPRGWTFTKVETREKLKLLTMAELEAKEAEASSSSSSPSALGGRPAPASAGAMSADEPSAAAMGMANAGKGELVIPCIYDEAGDFSEGLAAVKNKEKWGYIDKTGKMVIPCIYDYVEGFSEGLAVVRRGDSKNGKYGFVDKTGTELIPCIYENTEGFHEGLAAVRRGDSKNGKYGYIDKTGTAVIPYVYDISFDFSEGLAAVKRDDKYGFIDKTGKEVIPFIYDYQHYLGFSEGLAAVCRDDKYGYIDKTGKEVIPLTYTNWARNFSEGVASVRHNFRCMIIDKTGKVISDKYTFGDFSEGLGYVWDNNRLGYIDKTGKVLIPCIYDMGDDFSEGLARVRRGDYENGKWGYIDKTGTELVPFIYEESKNFSEGMARVKLDGKWGYIGKNGDGVTQNKKEKEKLIGGEQANKAQAAPANAEAKAGKDAIDNLNKTQPPRQTPSTQDAPKAQSTSSTGGSSPAPKRQSTSSPTATPKKGGLGKVIIAVAVLFVLVYGGRAIIGSLSKLGARTPAQTTQTTQTQAAAPEVTGPQFDPAFVGTWTRDPSEYYNRLLITPKTIAYANGSTYDIVDGSGDQYTVKQNSGTVIKVTIKLENGLLKLSESDYDYFEGTWGKQ